jgi:hypothetical protein
VVTVEKARKIEKLKVNLISLVKYPANRKGILLKSDGTFEVFLQRLHKNATEGILYGVVYEPDTVDTQDDYADATTIKEAAHDFLSAGRVSMIDLEHDYNADKGAVVESWILRGTHPYFPETKEGAWCVGIKLSSAAYEHIDEIGGISLAGIAIRKDQDGNLIEPTNLSTPQSRIIKTNPKVRLRKRTNN